MKTLTIIVEGVPDDILDHGWKSAIENAPSKIMAAVRTDHIVFNVAEMDNALAKPLAEMIIIAQTLAAIIAYQKEKN